MVVYVVRHGQSQANLNGLHAGQNQVPLTEKGREDAEYAGKRLEGIRLDRVYSSDQRRALQTAHIALPDWEPEQDARLREIDVGSLTGRAVADCEREYGEVYVQHRKSRDFTVYGGENDRMQYDRAVSFLKMLETVEGCENIAVFSHAGTIRCMCAYVLKVPSAMPDLLFANGSVTKLEYTDGRWRMWVF